jgi:hypothetical protein
LNMFMNVWMVKRSDASSIALQSALNMSIPKPAVCAIPIHRWSVFSLLRFHY